MVHTSDNYRLKRDVPQDTTRPNYLDVLEPADDVPGKAETPRTDRRRVAWARDTTWER